MFSRALSEPDAAWPLGNKTMRSANKNRKKETKRYGEIVIPRDALRKRETGKLDGAMGNLEKHVYLSFLNFHNFRVFSRALSVRDRGSHQMRDVGKERNKRTGEQSSDVTR